MVQTLRGAPRLGNSPGFMNTGKSSEENKAMTGY